MRTRKVVVAFGDSTTAPREGITVYPDLLQQQWRARQLAVDVINSGVRGDHTSGARARFQRDVVTHAPHVVILRFGINDAAVDVWASPPASAPRVPLVQFRENIVALVQGVRAAGAVPLLCTPNPLAWSEVTLGLYGRSPYQPEDADGFNVLLKEYTGVLRELAAHWLLPFADIDAAFRHHASEVVPPWQSLLLDGMHPNDAGQRLAAELLIPLVDEALEIVT